MSHRNICVLFAMGFLALSKLDMLLKRRTSSALYWYAGIFCLIYSAF